MAVADDRAADGSVVVCGVGGGVAADLGGGVWAPVRIGW
jgi:hypothetical protein